MEGIITRFLERLKIGRRQARKNLALYPLLSTYSIGLDYLLLDEALGQNLIEVVEVSEGGSVPKLKVVNKSVRLVLILDGRETPVKSKFLRDYEVFSGKAAEKLQTKSLYRNRISLWHPGGYPGQKGRTETGVTGIFHRTHLLLRG